MGTSVIERLRGILGRRMAYGGIILPGERVDPSGFPEEEFPVWCPTCDYLLQGLSADRCPECGGEFDRGRLLVEQYVIERGMRLGGRTYRYMKRMLTAGALISLGAVGLCVFAVGFFIWTRQARPRIDILREVLRVALGVQLASLLLFFASSVLNVRLAALSKKKVAAVRDGIDRDTPAYRKIERRWRVFWAVVVALVVVIGVSLAVVGWINDWGE